MEHWRDQGDCFLGIFSFSVLLPNVKRQVDFWRFVFMAFLSVAVTLDTDIAILSIENL